MTTNILTFEENTSEISELAPLKKAKPKKAKKPKATSTKGQYLTNAVLLPAMLRAKEQGVVTPELAMMFQKIVERYSLSKNFAHLSHLKEDMISAAVLNLIQNGLKFNPEKSSNVFSYVTQCAYHSYLQVIQDDKNHRNIRDSLLLKEGAMASLGFMEAEHDNYREKHSDLFDVE
jgi:hypothetical protein